MTSLRLVFAGSPAVAVPSLTALLGSRHDVAAVITREDSPQGRRGILTPTPVAGAAVAADIPLIRANQLTEESTELVRALGPDLGVIVAYGGMVREPLLSTPRLGWINLHFSLLPSWRGAAPVQRAIMAGDTVTGASVFRLVDELDAGDVYGTFTRTIGAHQTSGSLLDQLAEEGADLLVRVVDELADGTATAAPQLGEVTYAPKLTLSDGAIDWHRAAPEVFARIRAVTPEPGAHTSVDDVRLKVLGVAMANDATALPAGRLEFADGRVLVGTSTTPLELLRVHPAGRKAMDAAAWWRGRPSGAQAVAS